MAVIDGCPTLDEWSLCVSLVSDVAADIDTYRGWHADARVPFSGDAVARGLFACAARTITNRVGSHALVDRASAPAGLAIARTLLSHATMLSNWPGMRDRSGVGCERLISLACDEHVAILKALGLVRMDARSASRVVRVGIVVGKGGMYLRHIDRCGQAVCGAVHAWDAACDPFLDAETMLAVGCLAAARGCDSDEAARGLAPQLVEVAGVWDAWQRRHAPSGMTFEEPDGRLVGADELTSCMYGWCALSGRHPIDCVLPMKSSFRAQAIRTYDAVMVARRNAGKTWARYR